MIKLSIESYCHKCTGFVPIVTTDRTKKHVDYIVRCQSFARCKAIEECMKKMGADMKGEWIVESVDLFHGEEVGESYTCSVCGKDAFNKFDFCPNCGADMRGGDA